MNLKNQKRTIKHYLNLLDRLHYPSTTIYAYEILLLQNVGILLLNLVNRKEALDMEYYDFYINDKKVLDNVPFSEGIDYIETWLKDNPEGDHKITMERRNG